MNDNRPLGGLPYEQSIYAREHLEEFLAAYRGDLPAPEEPEKLDDLEESETTDEPEELEEPKDPGTVVKETYSIHNINSEDVDNNSQTPVHIDSDNETAPVGPKPVSKDNSFLITSEEKFNCERCERQFKGQKSLRNHFQSIHLGLLPYSCSRCGFTYATSHMLTKHKRDCINNQPCKSGLKLYN